jgi:hypothetical protein
VTEDSELISFSGCDLRGRKENVIVDRLIPAGTGMEYYRNIQLSQELEEAAARVQQEVTAAFEEGERELGTDSAGRRSRRNGSRVRHPHRSNQKAASNRGLLFPSIKRARRHTA